MKEFKNQTKNICLGTKAVFPSMPPTNSTILLG